MPDIFRPRLPGWTLNTAQEIYSLFLKHKVVQSIILSCAAQAASRVKRYEACSATFSGHFSLGFPTLEGKLGRSTQSQIRVIGGRLPECSGEVGWNEDYENAVALPNEMENWWRFRAVLNRR